MTGPFAAIVLAGGHGSRLGGTDKAAIDIDGQLLIDHVYAAVADCAPLVAVGPSSLARPGVTVVREDPPFGGPAAGVGAGLDVLTGRPRGTGVAAANDRDPVTDTPGEATSSGETSLPDDPSSPHESSSRKETVSAVETWLLACDLPRAPGIVDLLTGVAIPAGADAIVLADQGGHAQWLAGRYRIAALQRAVAVFPDLSGVSMKRLLAGIRIHTVTDQAGVSVDLDTWPAIDHYRSTREDGR